MGTQRPPPRVVGGWNWGTRVKACGEPRPLITAFPASRSRPGRPAPLLPRPPAPPASARERGHPFARGPPGFTCRREAGSCTAPGRERKLQLPALPARPGPRGGVRGAGSCRRPAPGGGACVGAESGGGGRVRPSQWGPRLSGGPGLRYKWQEPESKAVEPARSRAEPGPARCRGPPPGTRLSLPSSSSASELPSCRRSLPRAARAGPAASGPRAAPESRREPRSEGWSGDAPAGSADAWLSLRTSVERGWLWGGGLCCTDSSQAPRWTLLGTSMTRGWGTWMRTPSAPVRPPEMSSRRRRRQRHQQPPSSPRDPCCSLSLSGSLSRRRTPCRRSASPRASPCTPACCTAPPALSGHPPWPTPPPSSTLPPGKAASSTSMTTCLATLQVPQPQVGLLVAAGTGRPAPWHTGGTATPSRRSP